jgi:nitrogen regulatory protein P-II 1
MKKIEATVRLNKVADVCTALEKADYPEFTTTEIESHAKSIKQPIRGRNYKVGLMTRARIDVVVKDSDAERIINTIRETAFTDEIDDGNILILTVDNIVRAHTAN